MTMFHINHSRYPLTRKTRMRLIKRARSLRRRLMIANYKLSPENWCNPDYVSVPTGMLFHWDGREEVIHGLRPQSYVIPILYRQKVIE